MRISGAALAGLFFAVSLPASPTPSSEPDAGRLQAEIRRLALPIGGTVGVAAWRIDGRGPRVLVNAEEPFPMASTFKVAVAGAILAKVDAGALALDRMLPVDPAMYVESEMIAETLLHPGVSLSVHNLLDLMLTRSDNTATDVLTAAAGGPEAVTAWVRKQGVNALRVDRDTAGILRDFFALPKGTFSEALAAARKADPKLDARHDQLAARHRPDRVCFSPFPSRPRRRRNPPMQRRCRPKSAGSRFPLAARSAWRPGGSTTAGRVR